MPPTQCLRFLRTLAGMLVGCFLTATVVTAEPSLHSIRKACQALVPVVTALVEARDHGLPNPYAEGHNDANATRFTKTHRIPPAYVESIASVSNDIYADPRITKANARERWLTWQGIAGCQWHGAGQTHAPEHTPPQQIARTDDTQQCQELAQLIGKMESLRGALGVPAPDVNPWGLWKSLCMHENASVLRAPSPGATAQSAPPPSASASSPLVSTEAKLCKSVGEWAMEVARLRDRGTSLLTMVAHTHQELGGGTDRFDRWLEDFSMQTARMVYANPQMTQAQARTTTEAACLSTIGLVR
jgi:hypothetical protein